MQLQTRIVDRLLWALCALSALAGIVLLTIFLRFGALQQEFLDINFDAVHSTRALLRAEVLVTRALGELRLAEREAEHLQRAAENLEAALTYERNGQYRRSPHEQAVLARAQTLLIDMRQAAQRGQTSPDEARLFSRRLRELAQRFADADGDRWGTLFSLNGQLRTRMESNHQYGFVAAVLLLLLTVVMALGVIRKRQLDAQVAAEKETLEQEVEQRKRMTHALHESEAALFSEKERAQVTLHSIGEAVVTTDRDGCIEFLNPAAETLCGWRQDEARGRPLAHVLLLNDENTHERMVDPSRQFREGGSRIAECAALLIHRGGEEVAVQMTAAPILDRELRMTGVVVVLRDVREARVLERELPWQASHDTLTGLCNRREFENRLATLLAEPGAAIRMHAMLYLDLDQFKVVNDTCGHMAGDELLRQIGASLQAPLQPGDILARLGGDEFGVLLFGCTPERAVEVAGRLREAIEAFQFIWTDKRFSVGVSIGLIHFDSAAGLTVQDVMSRTDAACYMAKDLGRNRIQIYRQDDDEMARRYDEMEWVGRIRQALQEGRFVLFRQPIAPLTGRGRPHNEVLLRLRDESGELVAPMTFIPAAERYGLMSEVDRWVIAEALRLCALETAEGGEASVVAINLSGASLANEQLVTHICECFERTGVDARRVCFEITETAAITHLDRAIRLIHSLKLIGCRFALDDFGSGMSSFGYLKRLPVDYLKIDGSFIRGLHEDAVNRAMVRSINDVGHAVRLKTVAEFVESEAELAILREIGIDYAQGYHIGRPEAWVVKEAPRAAQR